MWSERLFVSCENLFHLHRRQPNHQTALNNKDRKQGDKYEGKSESRHGPEISPDYMRLRRIVKPKIFKKRKFTQILFPGQVFQAFCQRFNGFRIFIERHLLLGRMVKLRIARAIDQRRTLPDRRTDV